MSIHLITGEKKIKKPLATKTIKKSTLVLSDAWLRLCMWIIWDLNLQMYKIHIDSKKNGTADMDFDRM